MTVRIGFSTPRRFNPVSWLVRKLTRSEASHTWFVYEDADWGQDFVLEAHELGFRLLPYERFARENHVVRVVTPQVPIGEGLKWAAQWLGTAYDFTGLFGMALVLFGRVLRLRLRNPLQRSHAMFCSEMAVTVLQRCGYPGAAELDAGATSPQDLLDFMILQERCS